MFRPPGDCPVCGAFVAKGRKSCLDCGADDRSGWKDDDGTDGLDLPDNDFNYDEFVKNEFGSSPKPQGLKPLWWIVGVVLLLILLIGALAGAL